MLKVRGSADKPMRWDTLGDVIADMSGEKVLALVSIENNVVQMLTTGLNFGPRHAIVPKKKRPRLTSTNDAKVPAMFGNEPTKALAMPVVIDEYSQKYGNAT